MAMKGRRILKIALVVGLPIAVYAIWSWRDVASLEKFCADIRPGTEFSSLRTIAEVNGIDPRYIRTGIRDNQRNRLFLAVPARSTMGHTVCAIHYNQEKQIVISAEMWRH
jgi:hypothetical protein